MRNRQDQGREYGEGSTGRGTEYREEKWKQRYGRTAIRHEPEAASKMAANAKLIEDIKRCLGIVHGLLLGLESPSVRGGLLCEGSGGCLLCQSGWGGLQ